MANGTSPEPLYQKCPLCGGTRTIKVFQMSGPCVGCDHTGFVQVGITTDQLDGYVLKERALQGDPGVPLEKRLHVLRKLKTRVEEAIKKAELHG